MYSSSSSTQSRGPASFVLVAAIHLAVLWAFLNGFHIRSQTSAPPDLIDLALPEKPRNTDSPPPRDTFEHPDMTRLKITQPEVPEIPVIADAGVPEFTSPGIQIGPTVDPGPGSAVPVITAAAVDPHHPLTQPPYPMSAIRGNEEGTLDLAVLVAADGRVRDVKIARSSGFEQLDGAAMKEAKSHWRLRPATRDGVAFEQWLTLRVVFKLENH